MTSVSMHRWGMALLVAALPLGACMPYGGSGGYYPTTSYYGGSYYSQPAYYSQPGYYYGKPPRRYYADDSDYRSPAPPPPRQPVQFNPTPPVTAPAPPVAPPPVRQDSGYQQAQPDYTRGK